MPLLLLPAILTHREVPDTLALFERTLQASHTPAPAAPSGHDTLVVDASDLQQFDSSALSVLLECQRVARSRRLAFAVRGLPARLEQLAGLYGVNALLQGADARPDPA